MDSQPKPKPKIPSPTPLGDPVAGVGPLPSKPMHLRADVIGWGVDLDERYRPGVPREKNRESVTDVNALKEYHLIEPQKRRVEILKSSEHMDLPPIFGTSCPPHGVSGMIRRFAFRYSEGQKLHWVLLLLADRVDVVESEIGELLHGRIDNPFKSMGLKSEFRKGAFFTRFHKNRADTRRMIETTLLVGGIAAGAVGCAYFLKKASKESEA